MSDLKDLAKRVTEVARSAGASDAVAEAIDSTVRQVRFSDSQIDAVNSWTEKHLALFVAVGKRLMSSDIRDLGSADAWAKKLVELAKKSPPSKTYGGVASGKFKYKHVAVDRKIVDLRDPSKYVRDAIDAAESEGASSVGGTFYAYHERTGISSSGGAVGDDESTSVNLSVRAFSQPEASGHAVCCTPRLSRMDAAGTGHRAGELSVKAKDPISGKEGKFDLVLEPLCLGSFTQSTSGMISALRVEISTSMYARKIGKQVASKEITFVDDPTVPSTSSRKFDHEGVPTRRNILIKNGVLKTYLHNTSTAKRFKTKTTASAGPLVPTPFSFAAQPIPVHPILETGDWSVDEIIEDTKEGLYLNNTWYTRFQNYSTGEFSTIPRDAILVIRGGEIVGAAKNIRISDNMMNFWKSVDALSKSSQEVYWWEEAAPPSTLPFLRAKSMTITKSS
jgi:PmbA protein